MPLAPRSDDGSELPPPSSIRKVAVTGAAKGLGRLVMAALSKHYDLVGLDRDPLPDEARPRGEHSVEHHVCDLTQRAAEDIFRCGAIDAVVHLAFEDDPRSSNRTRFQRNVLGTMKLLDYVSRYEVRSVVLLSTAAVYGAHPHHPAFLAEDAPLRALETYSGLRDRVEADRYAQAWMWRQPQVRTAILRPCFVVGPTVTSPLKVYLTSRLVPVLLGFDPMMQVLHEDDLVHAVVLALRQGARGIYNCSGAGELSLLEIIREVGGQPLPIPHPIAYGALRRLQRLRLLPFIAPQIDFLRYFCLINDRRIRRDLGFSPRVGLRETFRSIARQKS